MNIRQKIESYFGMDLKNVIETLHWEQKKSINSLAKMAGVCRQSFIWNCKLLNLDLMKLKQANTFNRLKGEKHPSWGLNKSNSVRYKKMSLLMKSKNPIWSLENKTKRATSMREALLKRKLKQEIEFEIILNKNKVTNEKQHPIGPYNIDFFIPNLNLCIEIDSTSKWGKERKIKADIRDKYLSEKGFKVLRINKDWIKDESFILNILNTNNVIPNN